MTPQIIISLLWQYQDLFITSYDKDPPYKYGTFKGDNLILSFRRVCCHQDGITKPTETQT